MAAETMVTGIAPEDIGLILVGDNVRATAHGNERLAAQMQGNLNMLLDSEYGGQVVAGISLDEAVAEAGPGDIIIPRGGDGTVRWAVNKLIKSEKHQTAILPEADGNANDYAVAHVGKASPLTALQTGQRAPFWPLEVILQYDEEEDTEYAAAYCTVGATVEAVLNMDEARQSETWDKIKDKELRALAFEFGISVRSLARALEYEIISDDGQTRRRYNQMFSRNQVIAKQGRIPQVNPHKREMFTSEIARKRFTTIAASIGKLATGRLPGKITDEAVSFIIGEQGTFMQLDGDPRELPPHTKVTIGPSITPLQTITTRRQP